MLCNNGLALMASQNTFFDDTYFDDDDIDEDFLDEDCFIDDGMMLNMDAEESMIEEIELFDDPICLDETSPKLNGCFQFDGFLSEINDLRELLQIMDDPKKISDLKSRIRTKRLQFLKGLRSEKSLREDLLHMVVLFEDQYSNLSAEESDDLLEDIFTHKKFLDEFFPLRLERMDGYREQITFEEPTVPDMLLLSSS